MCNNLKDKSAKYEVTAAFLQNKSNALKNDYCPVIAHSAYYSCYQLMFFIFKKKMKKTDTDLEIELQNFKKTYPHQKAGRHIILANLVGDYINKIDTNDYNDFSKITLLRKLRVKADYFDEPFTYQDSSNAIMYESLVLPILKKYS